ncbi:MAG: hypothetical protein AAGD32_09820 [Planctomycetota bacterium]
MAVARQSSSTGPIVYAVIATVLFVVAAVLAVMQYASAQAAEQELADVEAEYGDIVSRADTQGADVNAIKDARGTDVNASTPVVPAAVQMIGQLSAAAAGNAEGNYQTAIETIRTAQAAAAEQVADAPGGDQVNVQQANAVETIDSLTNALVSSLREQQDQQDELAAMEARLAEMEQTLADQKSTFDESVEKAQQDAAGALGDAQQTSEQAEEVINGVIAQLTAVQEAAAADIENMQVEIRSQRSEIAQKDIIIQNLSAQLADLRPSGMQISQMADGRIEAVAGGNTVYISLGRGDGITAGMTFEVFESDGGVPSPLTDTPEVNDTANLPRGKASIEIVRVQPNNAEARIVGSRGTPVQEGDLIVNIAYDKNLPLEMYVYGEFDLDRDGRATSADTQVVRQLVTQFGGNVDNTLGPDTDFVVIGLEPVIPEGLDPSDPIDRVLLEEAEEAQAQYAETLAEAKSLSIPILNQNRFLVFVGYYDLAPR